MFPLHLRLLAAVPLLFVLQDQGREYFTAVGLMNPVPSVLTHDFQAPPRAVHKALRDILDQEARLAAIPKAAISTGPTKDPGGAWASTFEVAVDRDNTRLHLF